MRISRVALHVMFGAAFTIASAVSASDRTWFVADRTLMPDGTLASGRAVAVESGRIVEVVDASRVNAGEDRLIRVSGVLSPGFVELQSVLGVRGDNLDRKGAINTDVSVAEAFDPFADDVRRALRHGVTAAAIKPASNNLFGGVGAVVRTWTDGAVSPVIRGESALQVTLGDSAYGGTEEPTSRAGALELLRRVLSRTEQDERIANVLSGSLDVVVECDNASDVRSALMLLGSRQLSPVLHVRSETLRAAESLSSEGAVRVIVDGPTYNDSAAMLEGVRALGSTEAVLAFAGGTDAGDPDSLRRSAALAVKSGMSPDVARKAMTMNAATIAGVGDQIGSIAVGRRADFVVLSDDPLRLDARVLAVWIDGHQVHASSPHPPDFNRVIGATDD